VKSRSSAWSDERLATTRDRHGGHGRLPGIGQLGAMVSLMLGRRASPRSLPHLLAPWCSGIGRRSRGAAKECGGALALVLGCWAWRSRCRPSITTSRGRSRITKRPSWHRRDWNPLPTAGRFASPVKLWVRHYAKGPGIWRRHLDTTGGSNWANASLRRSAMFLAVLPPAWTDLAAAAPLELPDCGDHPS